MKSLCLSKSPSPALMCRCTRAMGHQGPHTCYPEFFRRRKSDDATGHPHIWGNDRPPMKRCPRCLVVKPKEFWKNGRAKTYCSECTRIAQRVNSHKHSPTGATRYGGRK